MLGMILILGFVLPMNPGTEICEDDWTNVTAGCLKTITAPSPDEPPAKDGSGGGSNVVVGTPGGGGGRTTQPVPPEREYVPPTLALETPPGTAGWGYGGNASAVVCGVPIEDTPQPDADEDDDADPAEERVDVAGWAAYAVAQLKLPSGTPRILPDPRANEWGMAAVGQPLWLSTEGGTGSVGTSVTQQGITITLNATWERTQFVMGDGTTVSCTSMTSRGRGTPAMAKSPDCGHTYVTAGEYQVRATSWWRVSGTGLGQSGVFVVPRQGSVSLDVGELHSVITSRR